MLIGLALNDLDLTGYNPRRFMVSLHLALADSRLDHFKLG